MKRLKATGIADLHPVTDISKGEGSRSLKEIVELIGIETGSADRFAGSIPFSLNDTTAGCENELQTAVRGNRRNVDLPLKIIRSNFFENIIRRAAAGETSKKAIAGLEKYLNDNPEQVWENSWVRFPLKVLSPFAREVLENDLLADKKDREGGLRGDIESFIFYESGEKWIRIPVSYLVKLSLADVIGAQKDLPRLIAETGRALLDHFSNDNTSPETFSFYVVPLRPGSGMGRAIARETAKRFLLTQLLCMYANTRFKLRTNGQEALVYSAPHPPVRQRELNEYVSDSFYRELFMSPCLSGWDRGEEKHDYMGLCHQVLSRSQLNAVAKLREAGIITRNLVVLPNMSNISLANNGTHLSLGSIKLTKCLADKSSGFSPADEKLVGDLVIKTVEHFLPLFVGTYSASPYRLDFSDFHPEKALGFLPHELDYTHLRMIWRRWKKKAALKVFGHPITPFGPDWLDRMLKFVFRLKGDFIPDFRLIDYFVSLMSTDQSPALDGRLGNAERLKRDLADLGIFDRKMATYLLCRLREYGVMGFSGIEGRYYSLFESMTTDLARAADLQTLINATAFKYIAQGKVSHAHIPDTPSIESERRQIFFGAAIGIPTFFVRKNTQNVFLKRVVERCAGVRQSRRYPGYLRVYNLEYRKALLAILREDAADLIEALELGKTLEDLGSRLEYPEEHSAFGKITRSILDEMNARSSMHVDAKDFNLAAEKYYRETLRKKHIEEAIAFLEEDSWLLDSRWAGEDCMYKEELGFIQKERRVLDFLNGVKQDILDETASPEEVEALINFVLITIDYDMREARAELNGSRANEKSETSIHRAAHW